MATITYGAALGNLAYPLDYLDFDTIRVRVTTSGTVKAVDANGAGVRATGTGLTYDGNDLIGGTLASVTFFNGDGATLYSITGASLDAAAVSVGLTNDWDVRPMLVGDDLVKGTANRNVMLGGAGDDTLRGGAGGDIMVAMSGRDEMAGGAGRDMFVFMPRLVGGNTGNDVILDFADNDARLDDVIVVTRAQYDAMTATETARGVLLDFGGKADLLVLNATIDQIGFDDFIFRVPEF